MKRKNSPVNTYNKHKQNQKSFLTKNQNSNAFREKLASFFPGHFCFWGEVLGPHKVILNQAGLVHKTRGRSQVSKDKA